MLTWQNLCDQNRQCIHVGEMEQSLRKILLDKGLLLEIVRGWYLLSRSQTEPNWPEVWRTSFWPFCARYLDYRFGQDWCLSANTSLLLHAENWNAPSALTVIAKGAKNRTVRLPFGTSLFCEQPTLPEPDDIIILRGIRMFTLTAALMKAAPGFYADHVHDAQMALEALTRQDIDIKRLTRGDNLAGVGRLIGALRSVGAEAAANEIRANLTKAGHICRVIDPFTFQFPWHSGPEWQISGGGKAPKA